MYYIPRQSYTAIWFTTIHDRTLPERTSNLVDCNFIIRMLYLNAY